MELTVFITYTVINKCYWFFLIKREKNALSHSEKPKNESTKFHPFRKFSCLGWEKHALKCHLISEMLCHIHINGHVLAYEKLNSTETMKEGTKKYRLNFLWAINSTSTSYSFNIIREYMEWIRTPKRSKTKKVILRTISAYIFQYFPCKFFFSFFWYSISREHLCHLKGTFCISWHVICIHLNALFLRVFVN